MQTIKWNDELCSDRRWAEVVLSNYRFIGIPHFKDDERKIVFMCLIKYWEQNFYLKLLCRCNNETVDHLWIDSVYLPHFKLSLCFGKALSVQFIKNPVINELTTFLILLNFPSNFISVCPLITSIIQWMNKKWVMWWSFRSKVLFEKWGREEYNILSVSYNCSFHSYSSLFLWT